MADESKKDESKKKEGNFATPDMIAQWKRKYGEVFEFSHCYDAAAQKYYVGYFHKPDISVLSNSMRFTDTNPMKAKEIVFNGCKLQCDKEMTEDVEIYLPLLMQVNALLQFKLVEVKNC